jgi:hypothetical protein
MGTLPTGWSAAMGGAVVRPFLPVAEQDQAKTQDLIVT